MQVICTSGAWWRGSVLPRGECWRGMVSWLTWQCCRSIPPGTARLIKKYVREQEFRNNAERASRRLIRQVERTGHADIRVGWEGGGAPLMVLDDQAWQHIDLNQLPISEDLRERLRQWSARFQAFPPCHIIDDHDWNEMDDQLRGFAGELRCVLGPEYRVAG